MGEAMFRREARRRREPRGRMPFLRRALSSTRVVAVVGSRVPGEADSNGVEDEADGKREGSRAGEEVEVCSRGGSDRRNEEVEKRGREEDRMGMERLEHRMHRESGCPVLNEIDIMKSAVSPKHSLVALV